MQVQPAGVLRGALDRRVEIEFLGQALPRKAAQPAQRHLDVARVELPGVVEIAERGPVPDPYGAAATSAFMADADTFGVIAVCTERARAGSANPLRAPLMACALLF